MVAMKNIRKRLAAILLSLTAVFGGLALAGVADAGTYWNSGTCNHATAGNRICVDISAGTLTVYDNSNNVIAGPTPAGWSGVVPTQGWIAYDFECNAGSGGNTTFATPGGYGLPSTVNITDTWAPIGGLALVNSSAEATVAWYANSNQGYECIVVP